MKADRTLRGEGEESSVLLPYVSTESYNSVNICVRVLLWDVGCDEGRYGHQGESQDEAQGEIDEGGATQQHSQVQHRHQLQHSPALLCPLT